MRKLGAILASATVAASLLSAAPARAVFGAVVQLPADTVYSPYGGPATVTFLFDEGDPATAFTIRLRQPGHGVLKEKDVLVDPASANVDSPYDVPFSWKELSVSVATDYVVDVRRQGEATILTSAPFTLLPRLVSDLSATPSPFYPLVQDGYKDESRIRFSLAADTVATTVRVFRADVYGRCCGTGVRSEELGPLSAGRRGWSWDGRRDDASFVSKGTFFVRIAATDTSDRSFLSKAQKVDVTRGVIRLTATKTKHGSGYARVADERETARGGDCLVSRHLIERRVSVICANAEVSIVWKWALGTGERIESASFTIDGGIYGCHRRIDHTRTESTLRVFAPPTSTCSVSKAKITYSYPVQA